MTVVPLNDAAFELAESLEISHLQAVDLVEGILYDFDTDYDDEV
ncbi:MAG: hypothetical protein RIC55_18275 [Pirellulaceae bacterium]